MDNFSWDNPELKKICGECIYKDEKPEICNAVEPPIVKPFIPTNVSSCAFVRKSYWDRTTDEQKKRIEEAYKERSKRYYKK